MCLGSPRCRCPCYQRTSQLRSLGLESYWKGCPESRPLRFFIHLPCPAPTSPLPIGRWCELLSIAEGCHPVNFLPCGVQSTEPTRVTVSGNFQALSLAVNMISDICKGTFKGFALLRQMVQQQRSVGPYGPTVMQPRPVYAPGYGLIPPSQVRRAPWSARGRQHLPPDLT